MVDAASARGQEQQQAAYWEKQNQRRSPAHPVIEAFARPKVSYIVAAMLADAGRADLAGCRILDAGCGNGYFTHYLQAYAPTVGVDFSKTMLLQHPGTALAAGSVLALPFDDDAFDLVVCSNLLHHIEEPVRAVCEMVRVSKGYVALSEPNCSHPAMWAFHAIQAEERGALKFRLSYLRRLLREAELREVAASTQGSVLPNKCPLPLLPLFKPLDRVPCCRLYCVVVGAVGR